MGMTAAEPVDAYVKMEALSQCVNPSATHLALSRAELEQHYGLYQGSGGKLSGLFSTSLMSGTSYIPTSEHLRERNRLKTTIEVIRSTFGLTIEELAQVCQVQSRKTLYNWIDGKATPRKVTMRRIFDLFIIAQAWQQAGFANERTVLHRPVINKRSVFDLLSCDALDKALILFASSRLHLSLPTHGPLSDPFAE